MCGINNVGRGHQPAVLDLTDEDFDQMIMANVKSALYGMQAILPHFKERGQGHLIKRLLSTRKSTFRQ